VVARVLVDCAWKELVAGLVEVFRELLVALLLGEPAGEVAQIVVDARGLEVGAGEAVVRPNQGAEDLVVGAAVELGGRMAVLGLAGSAVLVALRGIAGPDGPRTPFMAPLNWRGET